MKSAIIDFINRLLIYDYLLFGGVILLFILLLLLAVVLRERLAIAVVSVISAFLVLTAGSYVGYMVMHHYLFKHRVTLTEVRPLEFTQALLIRGTLTNLSRRTFTECTLSAGVFKVTHKPYIDPVYPYIPFKKSSLRLEETIKPGESVPFKLFVEPFRYTKDFNTTVKADCR